MNVYWNQPYQLINFTKWMFLFYKKLRTKKWYTKIYNIEKWDKRYEELEKKIIRLNCIIVVIIQHPFQ